jgi:hypothetical protein
MEQVIRKAGMSQLTQEMRHYLSIMKTAIECNQIAIRQTRKAIEESRIFLKKTPVDGTT